MLRETSPSVRGRSPGSARLRRQRPATPLRPRVDRCRAGDLRNGPPHRRGSPRPPGSAEGCRDAPRDSEASLRGRVDRRRLRRVYRRHDRRSGRDCRSHFARTPLAALDFFACARPHLFFRLLLFRVSDLRPGRRARHSACSRLSRAGRECLPPVSAFRAHFVLPHDQRSARIRDSAVSVRAGPNR